MSHFSWWNCDRPIETFNCYTGTVVDSAGNPVAGAQVFASGVDYTGTSYDTTDAAGNYCVNVRRDSLVEIRAELVFGGVRVTTQTVSVDTTLPAGTVVSCALGGCTAVEDLALDGLTCVSGDVRDELDAPVAGALVVSTTGQFATTAADGSYCVAAPADSGVTVATPGLPPVSVITEAAGPDCSDPGACTPANLRPEPSTTTSCLSGRVVEAGFEPSLAPGDPVPDAVVEAFRSEAPFDLLGVAETDAAGEFCLEGLPELVNVVLSVEGPAPLFCFGSREGVDVGPAPSTCAANDCTPVGDIDCFSEGGYE